MPTEAPLLDVELNVDYPGNQGTLRGISFTIQSGQLLGLVGESGSGKSTLALALLRLLGSKGGRSTGHIVFRGRNLMNVTEPEMRQIRGREIGLVMQSPLASLNPVLQIGKQLAEAWRAHAEGSSEEQSHAVVRALEGVELPSDREFRRRYPSQISVGQAQRVLIAMATIHRPALLIADEPTSALDAVTQHVILQMIADLNRVMGSAVLYISHDLQSVASICERVAILHRGEIVECGNTEDVLISPQHPYTRQLVECARWLRVNEGSARRAQPGAVARDRSEEDYIPSPLGHWTWGIKSLSAPPIEP